MEHTRIISKTELPNNSTQANSSAPSKKASWDNWGAIKVVDAVEKIDGDCSDASDYKSKDDPLLSQETSTILEIPSFDDFPAFLESESNSTPVPPASPSWGHWGEIQVTIIDQPFDKDDYYTGDVYETQHQSLPTAVQTAAHTETAKTATCDCQPATIHTAAGVQKAVASGSEDGNEFQRSGTGASPQPDGVLSKFERPTTNYGAGQVARSSGRKLPTSHSNPCPVCSETDGNCRILEDDTAFCFSFADAKKLDKVNGYVCVAPAKGHTATFRPDNFNEWSEGQKREWQEKKKIRQQLVEQQLEKEIAAQMPTIERHRWYSQLLEDLKLNERDRQHLKNERRLTDEQIDRDGYRSVYRWQTISREYPENLPGVLPSKNFTHKNLNVCDDGILCPIKDDRTGLIVACQVRLTEAPEQGGRYRWLSSCTQKNPDGASPRLNGELPLGVFEPNDFNGDSLWLTEGTSFKPSITRYQLGVPVLAASGGMFNSSPQTTTESIEYLSKKYQTKILTFVVDAGDICNKQVMGRWEKQFEFFAELGYQCRVAWWGQKTKEHDDIDELVDFSQIEYISTAEFLKLKKNSQSESVDIEKFVHWAWLKWNASRKFTPDIKIKQTEFTFPLDIPKKDAIVAVKSGLGTRKTGAMLDIIRIAEIGSIIIGYRNNLLFQTGERASQFGLQIYHIREDGGIDLIADENTHQMLCLDSIHKIAGYFKGRDLWIDESFSVILHALNGGTLADNQARAIKILSQAFEDCNRIFLMDGNLTDLIVDFVASLAPKKKLVKIENTQKIAPHKIVFVDGIDCEGELKNGNRSPLIRELLKPDVVPWVFCDSKEATKVLDRLFKEAGKIGYVLNGETVADDWAKDFLSNPDGFIENKKPQYIILSPTAESGISCTLSRYFTHKFSFFVGVQGTNSQHQSMFRLRDNSITHYVFCPQKSIVKDRSKPQTYSENKCKEILNSKIVQSSLRATLSADNPNRAEKIIADAITRQQDEWWGLACKLDVLDTFEQDNLRSCLIHALKEAGHVVFEQAWKIDEAIQELTTEAKKQVQKETAQELFVAQEFDSLEEAKEAGKKNPNKLMQRRVQKTYLLDRIPGIKEDPIYSDDFILHCHVVDKHFLPQLQRYFLLKNYDISQKKHESDWCFQATGEHFFSARVKKLAHDTIWALNELNILQFEKLEEYCKDSPVVIDLCTKLKARKDIQIALNFIISEKKEILSDDRLEIISGMLSLIGQKNQATGQRVNTEGIKTRYYKTVPVGTPGKKKKKKEDPETDEPSFDYLAAREAILKCIDIRQQLWMKEKASKIEWEAKEVVDLRNIIDSHFPLSKKAEAIKELCGTRERFKELALCLSQEYQGKLLEIIPPIKATTTEEPETQEMKAVVNEGATSDLQIIRHEQPVEEEELIELPSDETTQAFIYSISAEAKEEEHSILALASKLRLIRNWEEVECSQDELHEAWSYFSEEDKIRLTSLHNEWEELQAKRKSCNEILIRYDQKTQKQCQATSR